MNAFPTAAEAKTAWVMFCVTCAVVMAFKLIDWGIDRAQFNECVQRNINLGAHWQIAERLCEVETGK